MPLLLLLLLDFQCGTSAENDAHLRELHEWLQPRARVAGNAGPASTLRDSVFFVGADESNAPYKRPVDLEQKSLVLTPADSESFRAQVTPLQWDADLGTRLDPLGDMRPWTLTKPFTVLGRSVSRLYITDFNSIHLDIPRLSSTRQYADYELASFSQAVIAPMLLTNSLLHGKPQIHARERDDALVVTWELPGIYRVQAVLFANGVIRFSYDRTGMLAGGVVVTTGSESWRQQKTQLASAADPPNDVMSTVPQALRGMLDVESVTASRLAGYDLVEFRIQLREAPDYRKVDDSSWLTYNVISGDNPNALQMRVVVYGTGPETRVAVPVFGGGTRSPAGGVDGRTVWMHIPDELLEGEPRFTVVTRVENDRNADLVATQPLELPAPARRHRIDVSASDGATLPLPVVEAFTLPVLDPARVWEQVRTSQRLSDGDVDAVAIYQTFHTDIVLYASAYATGGNAGAAGIRWGDDGAPERPRAPTLLHMNHLDRVTSGSHDSAIHVLMHELGHRWLFFVMTMHNGQRSHAPLNPLRAHPAQWVDTRAAFNVLSATDSSVMGGGFFAENGNGTFTTPAELTYYGYSWLDLYLMGLAAPSEVPPFFYLSEPQPPLGQAYYPPRRSTYTGTRRAVTVQQVIDATGARRPAYPDTQKRFKVAFVVVTDREVSEAELSRMGELRRLFESRFAVATGQRGEVTTTFVEMPPLPKRRAARH